MAMTDKYASPWDSLPKSPKLCKECGSKREAWTKDRKERIEKIFAECEWPTEIDEETAEWMNAPMGPRMPPAPANTWVINSHRRPTKDGSYPVWLLFPDDGDQCIETGYFRNPESQEGYDAAQSDDPEQDVWSLNGTRVDLAASRIIVTHWMEYYDPTTEGHTPNAETRKAIEEARSGNGLKRFKTTKDLLKDLND